MQWTVRRKLYAGFGSIVALVAIIAAIALVNMQSLIAHQKRMVYREAVMRNAYDTLALINFANSTLRGYSISIKDPPEAARIKDNLVKNWKQLGELTAKLREKLPYLENDEQKITSRHWLPTRQAIKPTKWTRCGWPRAETRAYRR